MGFMSLAQQYMEKGRLEGLVKGKLEGIAEGEAKGKLEVLKEMATKLLRQGISIDQVAQLTGLSVQEIEEIKE